MDAPSELLRAARLALDLSQRELADGSGVALKTIARLERNDSTITIETRRRLEKWFAKKGVTIIPDDGIGGPGLRVRRDLLKQGDLDF
jgi:transcriptional regulator with XRE-family HTH domain